MEQTVERTEVQKVPVELAFMDVDAVEQLRISQAEALDAARMEALSPIIDSEHVDFRAYTDGPRIWQEAEAKKGVELDDECAAYVAQYMDKDGDPELYAKLVSLLQSVSRQHMSTIKWYEGDPDDDGNYTKPETSGRALLRAALLELADTPDEPSEDDPETPGDEPEESEAVREARERLIAARTKLAELSIQRRRMIRKGSKKAKQLQEAYEAADKDYHEAFIAFGANGVKELREQGLSEDELRAVSVYATLTEHQEFTKAEAAVLEQDDTRYGKFIRWIAQKDSRLFGTSLVGGVAVGFGVRSALRAAAGTLLGVAGGAALGAGIAVGSTKALLKEATVGRRAHQIRSLDEYARRDHEDLQENVTETTDFDEHSTSLRSVIGERVKRDRIYNRNRVIGAAVVGAVGGIIGAEVAANVDWFHHSGTNGHTGGTGNQNPNINHGGGTHTPAHPGVTDGFHDHVKVEAGHGYTNELQDLAAQKGIHLSGADAWRAYLDIHNQVGGHFFNNDPSYVIHGNDLGISHAGNATWNPHAVHLFNEWLQQHQLEKAA